MGDASTVAVVEPRATLAAEVGLQLAPYSDSEGIAGYGLYPMIVGEAAVRVVLGVTVVAAWGAAAKSDDVEAGGLSNPYVGLRRRFGTSPSIEIELGATLPVHDLEFGNFCQYGLGDPPHSLVYSNCRDMASESSMYRAALGRGFRDPWLWAIDWNHVIGQLRAKDETQLGTIELAAYGGAAYDRNSDDQVGLFGLSGEIRPRCYGFGFSAAGVVGDATMAQFAGHVSWRRHIGPTTYEIRLDVPVPDPEDTALSFGVTRDF